MPRKPKSVMECALGLLVVREHSAAEVVRKLRTKGYSKVEVDEALEKLQAQGMQNDARYAVARARYRATVSKWGWAKIVQELKAQGIEGGLIATAKAGLEEEGVVFSEMAKKAIRGTDREKALARLVRRGYSLSEAKAALDEVGAEE
jgi:regulatory protein